MVFSRLSILVAIAAFTTLLAFPRGAEAVNITYTLSGTGSGSFNGVSFGTTVPSQFTFTGIADTANTSVNQFDRIQLTSLTIQVGALPLATVNQTFYLVNFSSNGSLIPDTLGFADANNLNTTAHSFSYAGAGTYNLISNTNSGGTITLVGNGNTPTDQGDVMFTSFALTPSASFSAVVSSAPEPGTLAFLALGGGLVLLRRSPKKRALEG